MIIVYGRYLDKTGSLLSILFVLCTKIVHHKHNTHYEHFLQANYLPLVRVMFCELVFFSQLGSICRRDSVSEP